MADDVAPFMAHGDPFVPGDDLALYSAPLWRDTPLAGDRHAFAARFWDDGTPRLTAYEYQGLLESRCAQRGALTCTTCHGMHDGDPRGQVRPSALGDQACTGCHTSLASTSDMARHTHHDPAGPGSRCVSCHMPRIVYGVLDAHRSHRIEIPDPVRAIATGRPDACTLCHVESDRGWAMRQRASLWPSSSARAAIAAGVSPRQATPEDRDAPAPGDDHLAPEDALFAGDPVARALAADAIGRAPWPSAEGGGRQRPENHRWSVLLAAMAGDRYPAVRHLAARALTRLLYGRRPAAARLTTAFDATADTSARDSQIAALRDSLSLPVATPSEVGRIAALRARARLADIDIGE
jgi:predicted CXXCH cytochrome family protein